MRTCPRVTSTCAIDQLVPTANRYAGDLVRTREDEIGAEKGAKALAQQDLGRDDCCGGKQHRAAKPDGDARESGDGSPEPCSIDRPNDPPDPAGQPSL